jgi:Cu-Zn family superoxide dismutase
VNAKILLTVLAASVAGCVGPNVPTPSAAMRISLNDAAGATRAVATLRERSGGVLVRIDAWQTAAGAYGAHVHTTGRCDAPDFTSAGPHWNPTGRQHGRENPQGAHLGDLPNLVVGADGRGRVEFLIAGATVTGGAQAMRDADGAAIVVHAAADDNRTDPSGNSGARIACGVVG